MKAVVHAHPVNASAFAASGAQINTKYLAESFAILANVAYAEYRPMGSEELAIAVAEAIKDSNCAVMRNHGALAVGKNLLEAFDRLEVLEAAARISIINASCLKEEAKELSAEALKQIDHFMGRR